VGNLEVLVYSGDETKRPFDPICLQGFTANAQGSTDWSQRVNNGRIELSASRRMKSRDKQMLWVTGVGLAIIGLLFML